MRFTFTDFKGNKQNRMELGGRGAATKTIFGMPIEPMHITIKDGIPLLLPLPIDWKSF